MLILAIICAETVQFYLILTELDLPQCANVSEFETQMEISEHAKLRIRAQTTILSVIAKSSVRSSARSIVREIFNS